MLRLLNNAFPVCGGFYSNDRALWKMLDDVVQQFNLPAPRLSVFPRGHFHFSPLVIGGILDRNFHFIFYLRTEIQKATIDVYCEDTHENRVALTKIIYEHCQTAVIETLPPNPPFTSSSGNYANFKAEPMKPNQVIDRISILGNYLELGLARVSLIVPPLGFGNRGFDFMQLFPEGYFAVHDTSNFLEVDISLEQEMSETVLKDWFPEHSEAKFLPRTF